MHTVTDNGKYLKVDIPSNSSIGEVTAALQEEFSHPEYYRRNDIWEFGNGALALQFFDLDRLTERILHLYPQNATRRKTAIVVQPGMNEAFAKLWSETTGRLPYAVQIFSDLTTAETWINENN